MKEMRHLHILILAWCVLSVGMAVSATTEDDVYRVLNENGVKYDSALVHNGMIAGMLRAVDSRACLLSSNDINRLNNLVAIASTEKLGENIGYLKLNGVYKKSGEKIVQELEIRTNEYTSGYILDLRDAGGNDLDSINSIINRYAVSNTPLYEIKDNSGDIIGNYSVPSNIMEKSHGPLMVLINEKTDDASAILATLLKGKDGVMLIGTTTQKNRGLMDVVPFSGSEALYIVTKHVFPIGIEGSFTNGVLPDIVVTESENKKSDLAVSGKVLIGKNISTKARTDRKLMERVANDAVLRRATDVLLALKAVNSE